MLPFARKLERDDFRARNLQTTNESCDWFKDKLCNVPARKKFCISIQKFNLQLQPSRYRLRDKGYNLAGISAAESRKKLAVEEQLGMLSQTQLRRHTGRKPGQFQAQVKPQHSSRNYLGFIGNRRFTYRMLHFFTHHFSNRIKNGALVNSGY
jgi:hypothetical protein